VDPWAFTIAAILGTLTAPKVQWPRDRTRIVMAPPDTEPDLVLPPEPTTAAPKPVEQEVLCFLAISGPATVRAAASAIGVPRSTAWRSLQRLSAMRLVEMDSEGWQVRA